MTTKATRENVTKIVSTKITLEMTLEQAQELYALTGKCSGGQTGGLWLALDDVLEDEERREFTEMFEITKYSFVRKGEE